MDILAILAVPLTNRYGLLTNDSLIVASMQQRGVRLLATADRRLATVDEVEIRVQTDLGVRS